MSCSPWDREESDTTERLHFHFSLSCIGEGNGNPLQYSYLENPGDGGAWWAAVCGIAQSRTRLKRLSSSSSSSSLNGSRVWGRMDTCICMAESLFCSPEPMATLLIGYTPIQNKKLKRKKEKNAAY